MFLPDRTAGSKRDEMKYTKKENPQNNGGRPSKITMYEKKKELIGLMFERGFTEEQVSVALGVTRGTVRAWKKNNAGFSTVVKSNKGKATEKVKKALFDRACGYSHPEEKIFCYEGCIIRAETVKHYPPDTMSMIYWLNNRDPENWRNRKEITGANGKDLVPPTIVVSGIDE